MADFTEQLAKARRKKRVARLKFRLTFAVICVVLILAGWQAVTLINVACRWLDSVGVAAVCRDGVTVTPQEPEYDVEEHALVGVTPTASGTPPQEPEYDVEEHAPTASGMPPQEPEYDVEEHALGVTPTASGDILLRVFVMGIVICSAVTFHHRIVVCSAAVTVRHMIIGGIRRGVVPLFDRGIRTIMNQTRDSLQRYLAPPTTSGPTTDDREDAQATEPATDDRVESPAIELTTDDRDEAPATHTVDVSAAQDQYIRPDENIANITVTKKYPNPLDPGDDTFPQLPANMANMPFNTDKNDWGYSELKRLPIPHSQKTEPVSKSTSRTHVHRPPPATPKQTHTAPVSRCASISASASGSIGGSECAINTPSGSAASIQRTSRVETPASKRPPWKWSRKVV